jgi:membrane complex biogenesis BtpA family protein
MASPLPSSFVHRPAVIGMVHVGALPGTPGSKLSVAELTDRAVAEALIYRDAGVDGVMLENMHDRPYLNGVVGPEITAIMTRIATTVRAEITCPCGIQILAAANGAALAVAIAADLQFVRVEGFVFAHIADEGWIDGCAGKLLRERKRLGAEHIEIWADIKKKHSAHAITADVSLAETAQTAAYNLADAVIVTGSHTGQPADTDDLLAVKRNNPKLPIYIGSGITAENAHQYASADGFIVGSSLN